jgi:hypothetical protein
LRHLTPPDALLQHPKFGHSFGLFSMEGRPCITI